MGRLGLLTTGPILDTTPWYLGGLGNSFQPWFWIYLRCKTRKGEHGPTWGPEVDGQLFQTLGSAADLERSHLCRAETHAQFDTRLATRLRGSGGPLSLVSDRFEPETDDT